MQRWSDLQRRRPSRQELAALLSRGRYRAVAAAVIVAALCALALLALWWP